MYEEILKGIWRIQVPLPRSPLKVLNSYLIKGDSRHLLVDTGFNRPECREALEQALQELAVDRSKTDFFITHLHSDHSGLAGAFKTDTTKVFCSRADGQIMRVGNTRAYWEELAARYISYGLRSTIDDAIRHHPGFRFHESEVVDYHYVEEGELFAIGDYQFRCVLTPGHTPGHMCLYEAEKGILLAGDHILGDITPVISPDIVNEDPLSLYLQSLDKVDRLNLQTVLVAHRKMLEDPHQRITELKAHHARRLDEAYRIVTQAPQDAYEIASQMTWDIRARDWENFPAAQKWFATGEAFAHLQHLRQLGKVERRLENGIYRFYVV